MTPEDIVSTQHGLVATREYKRLRTSWTRLIKRGILIRALPGVLMDRGLAEDARAWIRAVTMWDPNAAVAGSAAALLTIDPDIAVAAVDVFADTKLQDRGMIRFHRRKLPSELLLYQGDRRVASPDLAALTAALRGEFEPATTALRKGAVTVDSLTSLANAWPLRDSREARTVAQRLSRNPWSVPEVEFHDLLRQAGISGWKGNHTVVIEGRLRHLDVAIEESRVGIEVNSFAHHSTRLAMERDYGRLNSLTREGWRMYSVTPHQIRHLPDETIAFVQSIVGRRHRRR